MVKKSLLVTLILLVLYGVYVAFFKVEPVGQYQSQENVIRAEKYMYNDSIRNYDIVVGTSLSAGLRMDMMPKGMYLLSLPGQSVYDGMALIEAADRHPKYIFIEQNSLLSEEHTEFIKFLFNKPNYYRKEYLPFMRDEYQPAGQTYELIKIYCYGAIKKFTHFVFNPIVRLFHRGHMMDINRDEFYADAKQRRTKVDTEMVKGRFDVMKYWVNKMEKRGVKVCFYGMPSDSAVYFSNIAKTIRSFYPQYFPESKYTYVPPPSDIFAFRTTDQIHLDSASWIKFTKDFSQKVKVIRSK